MRVNVRQPLPTIVTFVAIASCRGAPTSPLPPANPVAPSPSPTVTLSGEIVDVLPDGTRRRSIGARQVNIEVEVGSPTDPQRGGWVPVDADGRYRLTNVPNGRFVKITSVSFLYSNEHRLCATNTITAGDTELDVALYLPGADVPGPTLSGQVSAVINGQRVPLDRVDIYFRSRGFGPDLVEFTDSNGRFTLCGIPPIPGTLYMFCANDIQPYELAVDIRADTVIDIDATPFYQCLVR